VKRLNQRRPAGGPAGGSANIRAGTEGRCGPGFSPGLEARYALAASRSSARAITSRWIWFVPS